MNKPTLEQLRAVQKALDDACMPKEGRLYRYLDSKGVLQERPLSPSLKENK